MNGCKLLILCLLWVAWLPANAQKVTYFHTDALGSPVVLTDANRDVVERREYEPYGRQLTPVPQDGPGYTGHVYDAATGMVYMQQRYYDPLLAAFLSPDPVTAYESYGQNFNRYWYASGNPYRFTDPDGRCGGLICEILGLQGPPEAIRDKTYDRADAIRGHDGRVLVGTVVASGTGGALIAAGGVGASAVGVPGARIAVGEVVSAAKSRTAKKIAQETACALLGFVCQDPVTGKWAPSNGHPKIREVLEEISDASRWAPRKPSVSAPRSPPPVKPEAPKGQSPPPRPRPLPSPEPNPMT